MLLGTSDDITTCELCGRSELKGTVALRGQGGDVVHYGSTCAALALRRGSTDREGRCVRSEAEALDRVAREAARLAALALSQRVTREVEALLGGSHDFTVEPVTDRGDRTSVFLSTRDGRYREELPVPLAEVPAFMRARGGRGEAMFHGLEIPSRGVPRYFKRNPFVSEAQRRLFHERAARGQMSPAVVAQWERETVDPFPAHAPRRAPSVLVAPKAVLEAFRRGLDLEREGYGGKGLVPDTIREARRLADGAPITLAKAHDMHGWLARHGASPPEAAARARSEQTPASVAWYLWGANPAIPYVEGGSRDPVFAWNRRVLEYFRALHARERR